jgi:hypothetical protein
MQLSELLRSVLSVREAEDRLTRDDALYVLQYVDQLTIQPPRRVLAVIALPWRRSTRDRWTRLVAFGRYRAAYAVIEELASVLAPTVLQTGLVPVVMPLSAQHVLGMTRDTPFVRRAVESGVVLFDMTTTQ